MESVASVSTMQANSFVAAMHLQHPGFADFPQPNPRSGPERTSPEGGGAPKSANLWLRDPLPDTAGASRRATCGDLADGRAALSP